MGLLHLASHRWAFPEYKVLTMQERSGAGNNTLKSVPVHQDARGWRNEANQPRHRHRGANTNTKQSSLQGSKCNGHLLSKGRNGHHGTKIFPNRKMPALSVVFLKLSEC